MTYYDILGVPRNAEDDDIKTAELSALLGLGAASMIYIAVADLIPGLHKRTELKATVQQMLLIGLGVLSIVVVRALAGE